ncbi:MAG: gamma carbonic anhydrase family protein [Bacteroidota bacterium]
MTKGNNVFIAPTATIIGDVVLGDNSSVWFGAVVRGDVEQIKIGNNTNIQDLSVIHADPGVRAIIGNEVIVGHSAIVHGAEIGDNTLIGMRATILNHSKIGKYCVIGANTLITEKTEIPDFSVVMGSPGKVVKEVSPEHRAKIKANAQHYVDLASAYLEGKF